MNPFEWIICKISRGHDWEFATWLDGGDFKTGYRCRNCRRLREQE